MAKPKKGTGPIIKGFGKSANWFERKTEAQLLQNEIDHVALTVEQVEEIKKQLKACGRSLRTE